MAGMASSANVLLDELDLGPGGEVDLVLSEEFHEGNWLPIAENATTLVVRHFFYDWDTEVASSLSIERIGGTSEPARRPAEDPRAVAARQLVALGDFVVANLEFFLQFSRPDTPNTFLPPLDGTAMGAAAENRPVIGSWQLDADEALIFEVAPPEGLYWSFSLGNPWWETIDYARHQSSLNGHQSAIDDDGMVRVVVAHHDPGVANWLDTAGHSAGPVILRCVRTESAPVPTARRREVGGRRGRAAVEHPPRHARGAQRHDRGPTTRGEQEVLPMTLDAEELEAEARQKTGLDDFGDAMFREGLEGLVRSFNEEADLTEAGDVMQHMRLVQLALGPAAGGGHLPHPPGDRRRGDRRAGFRHRAAPDGHHRAEPARGR